MGDNASDKPALLIIDMVKDTFDETHKFPITPFAKKIIDPINALILVFRNQGWPVVFPTDAFQPDDFLFKGRMKAHSIQGTTGAEVIDALDRRSEDLWLPKPRFSAFFGTDLDQWLRKRGVTLCAVAGITTNFCVLSTVMDALSHNFKAVILEDCCAAGKPELHTQTLSLYRHHPLEPLMRVMTSHELVDSLKNSKQDLGNR